MKVLLIGSGGREHALAFKIKQSKRLTELKVYPGNGGFPENEILPPNSINLKEKQSVQSFVIENKFDLVVVGPEEPLVDGIVDWLSEINIPCFGPSSYAAQLEGSKDFAKNFMVEFSIPTAKYETFSSIHSAIEYIENISFPFVIKADGLAAGKGVTVRPTKEEALNALEDIFIKNKFGSNNKKVVIEEFLEGEEASIFALCDGENFLMLPASQDHKRAFDNDLGPNTGGMGAYSPTPIVNQDIYLEVEKNVIKPVLNGMKVRGYSYKGLLYAGLMIKDSQIKVLEFNCRFGDPETQAVLLLLESDLLSIMLDCCNGNLKSKDLKIRNGFSSVVVLAAKGYPGKYTKNIPLFLPPPEKDETFIFHAGTYRENNQSLFSNGGRILGISSYSDSLKGSIEKSYSYISKLQMENIFFRKDIGKRAI